MEEISKSQAVKVASPCGGTAPIIRPVLANTGMPAASKKTKPILESLESFKVLSIELFFTVYIMIFIIL